MQLWRHGESFRYSSLRQAGKNSGRKDHVQLSDVECFWAVDCNRCMKRCISREILEVMREVGNQSFSKSRDLVSHIHVRKGCCPKELFRNWAKNAVTVFLWWALWISRPPAPKSSGAMKLLTTDGMVGWVMTAFYGHITMTLILISVGAQQIRRLADGSLKK